MVLDENIKAFVMYVISLRLKMAIHSVKKVIIPMKDSDFADILPEKLANVFLEQTGANEHSIELE